MKRIFSGILVLLCVVTLLSGCGGKQAQPAQSGERETITVHSPFRNATPFLELLKEKYPEINLEIIPYSGANMTTFVSAELRSGDI